MKYIIIEIQTMPDGNVANIVTVKDTREEAESAYHMILAAAAISSLPTHAATILDSAGFTVMNQVYHHTKGAE